MTEPTVPMKKSLARIPGALRIHLSPTTTWEAILKITLLLTTMLV